MSKVETEHSTTITSSLIADRLAYLVSLVGIVILPLFVIPWLAVPLMVTKVFWVILATLVTLVFWLIGRLQTGLLTIPKNPSLLGGLLVSLSFFVSSLWTDNISHSLTGSGFDLTTSATIGIFFLLLFLLSITFDRSEKVLNFYILLFITSLLIGLYSLFNIVTGAFSLTAFLSLTPLNLIGSWYSLGIFFGFIALSSLIIIELFPVGDNQWFKSLLLSVFAFSLLMLALINFYPAWIIFGFSSLLLFVYVITLDESLLVTGSKRQDNRRNIKILRPAFIALLISLFFIILGGQNGLVRDFISNLYSQAGFSFVDVRPSWSSTSGVIKGTLKNDVLLGVGPNNFSNAWLTYKPIAVNELPYWNTNFDSGVGLLPTFVVTGGVIGILAWTLFLVSLFYLGLKGIFYKNHNDFSRLVVFLLFVSVLYLWIFAFIYPVPPTLLALAFIVSGLLIAQLAGSGMTGYLNISLIKDPRVNFVSVLVTVVIVMLSVTGTYLVIQKYWATSVFYNTLNNDNTTNQTVDDLERNLTRVINLDGHNDLYFKTLTDVNRNQLTNLLQTEGLSQDELRQKFQSIIVKAVGNSETALNLNSQSPDNWISRGLVYELLVSLKIEGAKNQAESAYKKALELNPKSPAIRVDLARLEFTAGNNQATRAYLEEALTYKTNYTTALFMLAQMDLQAGKTKEALARVEQAVILVPNDIGSYFQLGFLRYRTGDFSGAVEALEQAITLSPNSINANAQYFLGLSYDALGQTSEAIKQFEVIEQFNQSNQEVKQILNNLRSGKSALSNVATPNIREEIKPPIEEN